jgi:Zn-dependent protease with chaperone function
LTPIAAGSCSALHAKSDIARLRGDHHLAFRLQLGLGALGLAAASAAVVAAAGSVHHDQTAAHDVVVLGAGFTYPAVNVAAALLLLLAALGVTVLVTAGIAIWRQLRAYRRFVAHVPVLGQLPGHPDVTVIADTKPQAFCLGYLRPHVYISTGAVKLLSSDELDAVLLHEQHHLSARDPLRLACARVLNQALFFLPALSPLNDRFVELAEARADDAAVQAAAGDRAALASALLAFEADGPPGSAGISPERVDALLGVRVQKRIPTGLIAASVAVLALGIVLVWRASVVASADATFNLPVVSSQPCMLVLALLPGVASLAALAGRNVLRSSITGR